MKKLLLKACLVLMVYLPDVGWSQETPTVTSVEILDMRNLQGLFPEAKTFQRVSESMALIRHFFQKELFAVKPDSSFANEAAAVIVGGVTPRNLVFEIMGVESYLADSILFSVNVYYQFSKSPLKLFQGFVKIGVDTKTRRVIFPLYNRDYVSVSYPNIIFYVREAERAAYLCNMERSERFLSGMLRNISSQYPVFIRPSKKLRYIIGDGYFKGLEYYNFYNYFITSRFIKDDYTIIDVIAAGYYRHELIHYILSGYPFNNFLNEGLATLLSGGEARQGNSVEADWKTFQAQIAADKVYANALDNADSLLTGWYKPEMYSVSALLLYRYKKKVGVTEFYKTLFEKLLLTSEVESLQFLKTALGIKQISGWMKSTDAAVWQKISSE